MEVLTLLVKTILLRPYVFIFLAAFLFTGRRLLGWKRTGVFFLITWATAFICEVASTRTGIPFGWYYYTGATVGQELYVLDVPFVDSLSFTFLLFASYCMALMFLLPACPGPQLRPTCPQLVFDPAVRTSWPVLTLTALFFTFIDIVIDPLALRGDRWFLGLIYGYPEPGVHFGVPVANYVGWAVVGLIALTGYFYCDRRVVRSGDPTQSSTSPAESTQPTVTPHILLGCGLYYGVLLFNLSITFWIGEPLIGMTGVLIYIPITALLIFRLMGRLSPLNALHARNDPPPKPSG